MLLQITNLTKSIGPKDLFVDLSLRIQEGEKVGIIGRNGLGKTTLFRIINHEDDDYQGEIYIKKDISIITTKQEHFFGANSLSRDITPLEYILADIPEYSKLKTIIDNYDEDNLEAYSDAITRFSDLEYYDIEDKIVQSLDSLGVDFEKALLPMHKLSGGEKRFVELVRIMYSKADLALIDEPTNHMDYIGKQTFIQWVKNPKHAGHTPTLVLITHDRDVLHHVDRIIELKDKQLFSYTGNYDAYLKQNSISTVSSINSYETGIKTLEKLHKQMIAARVKKFEAKSNRGRIAAKIMEERFQREYDALKEKIEKPSFWIDKESIDQMSDKVVDKYNQYKEKNIKIHSNNTKEHKKELLKITNLSLGYNEPLFSNINFELHHGEKVFIKGRNGAGKSTLAKKIITEIAANSASPYQMSEYLHDVKYTQNQSTIFQGNIKTHGAIRLGVYEQEISPEWLKYTLKEAVFKIYEDKKIDINEQKVKNVLSLYLFDPQTDEKTDVENLSGGQKARLQLIKMFCTNPNLLILDEPTNHLDLPSIEELEKALDNYHGGIIYISHDSYFIEKLGGEVVTITS